MYYKVDWIIKQTETNLSLSTTHKCIYNEEVGQ